MPRLTVIVIALLNQLDRVKDVRGDEQRAETHEHEQETDTKGDELLHVDGARIGPAEQPGDTGPDPLEDHNRQLAAVERQERHQVEQADEDVYRGDDEKYESDLLLPGDAAGHHLTGHHADSDHARRASR